VQAEKKMGSVSARYERAAQQWNDSGRVEPAANAWGLMLLSCWIASKGAKHDGVSQCLTEYEAALRKVVDKKDPNWLDNLFDGREYCSICSQSWRTENCSFCTSCSKAYPPCCADKRELVVLANGNRQCSACAQGEIVG
jgi:hypothetical protein